MKLLHKKFILRICLIVAIAGLFFVVGNHITSYYVYDFVDITYAVTMVWNSGFIIGFYCGWLFALLEYLLQRRNDE